MQIGDTLALVCFVKDVSRPSTHQLFRDNSNHAFKKMPVMKLLNGGVGAAIELNSG